MKKILPVFFFFISTGSFAQKSEKPFRFQSLASLVLINGSSGSGVGLQSVNGFQKKNLFAGLGVGLDYYIHRSVPLFADLRYEFGKEKSKFFAYADAGYNFPWPGYYDNNPIIIWEGNSNSTNYDGGIYSDIGMGYFLSMEKKSGFVFTLGHSHKKSKQTYTYLDWQSQQMTTNIYRYNLNRVVIKVGWRF